LGKLKQKFRDADLDEPDQRVDEALNEVRTVSHLLHPLSLELLGLRSSIMSYVQGYEQRTGIRTLVEIPDPLPKFDDVTRTASFRIIQECFTNVYKHAKASAINIRIGFSAEQFRMEVVVQYKESLISEAFIDTYLRHVNHRWKPFLSNHAYGLPAIAN
jgi:signal transduction histidine kinase